MTAPLLQQPPPPDADTRALPHALGPEKSILSSMMQDAKEYVGRAEEAGLAASFFYLPAHGTMFGLLAEAYRAGEPVELVSLVQRLIDRSLIDQVGGPSAVYDLFGYAPHAGHFDKHLRLVIDRHRLRETIRVCADTISACHNEPEEVDALLDATERRVMAIREDGGSKEDVSVGVAVCEWAAEFEEDVKGGAKPRGIETGYSVLDRLTGGLKGGQFKIVAARPSHGKSALLLNFLNHSCVDQRQGALVFSGEMTKKQNVARLITMRSGYDAKRLRDGEKPSKEELIRVSRAADEIRAAPIYIDDRAGLSIDAVRAKARRVWRDKGIKLIAVDYLQLLHGTSRQASGSREREVSEISAALKALAKELDVPVIALSQLSRDPEKRSGKDVAVGRPRLSDLRDSGSLEQDADLVIFLYPWGLNEDPPTLAVDLLLEKQRDGATGVVPLVFQKELSRFTERAFDPNEQKQKPKAKGRWG